MCNRVRAHRPNGANVCACACELVREYLKFNSFCAPTFLSVCFPIRPRLFSLHLSHVSHTKHTHTHEQLAAIKPAGPPQSRYTTNSMFQRQLSTNALNSSSAASSAVPTPRLFQRQMTASQLLTGGSSGATSGLQQQADSRRLLGGVRGDPPLASSAACLLGSGASPAKGARVSAAAAAGVATPLQGSGSSSAARDGQTAAAAAATKKPAKNKRIISRMLSISAIHTSSSGQSSAASSCGSKDEALAAAAAASAAFGAGAGSGGQASSSASAGCASADEMFGQTSDSCAPLASRRLLAGSSAGPEALGGAPGKQRSAGVLISFFQGHLGEEESERAGVARTTSGVNNLWPPLRLPALECGPNWPIGRAERASEQLHHNSLDPIPG